MRNRIKDKECQYCKQPTAWLIAFNHPPYNEKWNKLYCLGCIWAMEKDCRIPGLERIKFCAECGELFQIKDLHNHPKISTTGYGFCLDCLNKLIDANSIVCEICGDKTIYYPHYSKTICDMCYTKHPLHATVYAHNFRAKSVGCPATLTPEQWERTLHHFNNICAYCQSRPYQVLEHFYPIKLGKGTTIDNCLPACNRCNKLKNSKHPDKFKHLFPTENMTRIQAYFNSLI